MVWDLGFGVRVQASGRCRICLHGGSGLGLRLFWGLGLPVNFKSI